MPIHELILVVTSTIIMQETLNDYQLIQGLFT